jgi:DNA-binding MarR family transcriptional regulator
MRESGDAARLIRAWTEAAGGRLMHATAAYARKIGLTMPQMGTLRRIQRGGPCGVSDIGRHFDVSDAAASQLVDKLVQAGLVDRTESPDDRRVRQVALTAKGRAVMEKAGEAATAWIDDLVARLEPSQKAAVAAALGALMEAEFALPGPDAIRRSR